MVISIGSGQEDYDKGINEETTIRSNPTFAIRWSLDCLSLVAIPLLPVAPTQTRVPKRLPIMFPDILENLIKRMSALDNSSQTWPRVDQVLLRSRCGLSEGE